MSKISSSSEFLNTPKFFETIEDLANIGAWVLDLETEKTIWSKQVYAIYDLDPKTATDLEQGVSYYTNQSQILLTDAISKCLATGTTFRLKLQIVSAKKVKKDVLVVGKPEFKGEKIIKLWGAIQDITDYETQVRLLEDEQIKLNTAQSLSQFGHYETDLVKQTWTASDRFCRIFGFNKSEEPFTMSEFEEIVHPEDHERVMKDFTDALIKKQDFYCEYRCINRKTKETIWVKSTSKVEYDKDGTPIKILGVKYDATQYVKDQAKLKEANESLEEKNLQLEQFAYVTSHDLKSPINNIRSFVELIRDEIEPYKNEELETYLNYVKEAGDRVALQISTLLAHAKIGLDREIGEVDLAKVLRNVQEDLRYHIKDTNGTLEIPDQLPVIYGDETELRILFQNLISNGLKFSKENQAPMVKIFYEFSGDYHKFLVEDNGIGIPPEELESIFEMFSRSSVSSSFKGSGIGLAHCKKIVNLHNGKIEVKSELNKGSTFIIMLPNKI
ncbi:ATP-binding protein [Luteibaculum oceani]|uniref:histidine kinase n=1 Tax=Luteibaculum oceani TaxID=1294296 RepID=A0A5C6UWU8_9FLAO|nr:ATP-binding protein [Luteibaculum oceani]TXC77060.1 hypothetical protein FRX97_09350 [Luteibaculum oceani]